MAGTLCVLRALVFVAFAGLRGGSFDRNAHRLSCIRSCKMRCSSSSLRNTVYFVIAHSSYVRYDRTKLTKLSLLVDTSRPTCCAAYGNVPPPLPKRRRRHPVWGSRHLRRNSPECVAHRVLLPYSGENRPHSIGPVCASERLVCRRNPVRTDD